MKLIKGILIGFVLVALSAISVAYSGAMNVAATKPHTQLGQWLLHQTMKNSVQRHASGIQPPELTKERIEHGFEHYVANCAGCHAAPGGERDEIGKGLTPVPPRLADAAGQWSDAELFWITKHGIKMTGMPAWGASHSDEQIWDIVAFVRGLPKMSAQDYARMEQNLSGGNEVSDHHDAAADHDHAHGH